eukprot:251918_1
MSQQNEEISQQEQLFLEYKSKYLMVSCQEKLNCSFDRWYTQFRKQTIKSRIIPVNHIFIQYLKQDGLTLPPQIQSEMDNYYALASDNDSDYDNDDTFKEEHKETTNKTDNDSSIDFSLLDDLFTKIREKIKVLKDEVVPKLNWSAPKDAKWINNQTLRCDNVSQVLLLLKASQFVQHDLCHPFHGCFDYEANAKLNDAFEYKLILRKYSNLYPNREFRCFVYNRELVAITQRNDDDVFEELQSEITRNTITDCVQNFFESHVQKVFVSDKYVMDVYIDKEFKVYIIDFNPFYEFTDCGTVLSWMDICKLIEKKQQIVFGYVDSNETAKIKFNSNSQYRYPIDAVDLNNDREINAFVDSCKNNDSSR